MGTEVLAFPCRVLPRTSCSISSLSSSENNWQSLGSSPAKINLYRIHCIGHLIFSLAVDLVSRKNSACWPFLNSIVPSSPIISSGTKSQLAFIVFSSFLYFISYIILARVYRVMNPSSHSLWIVALKLKKYRAIRTRF